MKTPEQIADEYTDRYAADTYHGDELQMVRGVIAEAIKADRAQRGTEVLLTVARALYEIDEDLDEPMRTLDPEVHARLGEILNHNN